MNSDCTRWQFVQWRSDTNKKKQFLHIASHLKDCLELPIKDFKQELNDALLNGFPIDYLHNKHAWLDETLLQTAILRNRPEHAIAVIEAGADVNRQDSKGRNALMQAAAFRIDNLELNRIILSKTRYLQAVDTDGFTALSHWCTAYVLARGQKDYLPVIHLLLDSGLKPNIGTDWTGNFLESLPNGKADKATADKLQKYVERYTPATGVTYEELKSKSGDTYEYEL